VIDFGYLKHKYRDRLMLWLAKRLPKRFVMWCYIVVVAHATTGQYEDTVVPKVTAMEVLDRWPVR
jgi:hypothetical protein